MISVDSAFKKDKNYYPRVLLEEYIVKGKYYPEISSDESNEYIKFCS